jgi:hypothetical protein
MTNVIVSYESSERPPHRTKYPHLRVKIDGQGFPYVIIDHEKYIVNSAEDREFFLAYGLEKGYMKVLEGREELKELLNKKHYGEFVSIFVNQSVELVKYNYLRD